MGNAFRKELQDLLFNLLDTGTESHYLFDSEMIEFTDEVLIPRKAEIPHLFRYSPADYNNIRNLETQSIYLSEIGSMNDIFEGLSCKVNDKVIQNL